MEQGNTAQKRLSQALKSLNDFMEQPSPLDDIEALKLLDKKILELNDETRKAKY